MKILNDYFKIQEEIFNYFGYVENYRILPIENSIEFFWKIIGGEAHGGEVRFSEDETFEDDNKLYSNTIYTQRFLPKWVYRGKDYTMIVVDTHTEGNQYLQIFSNDKEKL